MKNFLVKILLLLFLFSFGATTQISAQQPNLSENRYSIYFGGIGCPHCAKVSPVLNKRVQEGGFIVIEYEIYKRLANSQVLNDYATSYKLGLGIPQIFFNKDIHESGDPPIINSLNQMIEDSEINTVYLANGTSVPFSELDINSLDRYPIIYAKDRVAVRKTLKKVSHEESEMIKKFISSDTVTAAITDISGKKAKTEKVEQSGGVLQFENALEIGGWLLQWNGESVVEKTEESNSNSQTPSTQNISLGRAIALGLADSINPCAISVLALMLIAIITYNPGDRKKILFAGLAFVLAVMLMYLLYGYLIITAFQFIQSIASIKLYIYKALGIGAIILGLLELKDYFRYKPGSIATEMPLFLRPKVSKVISKITSPIGAFGLGLFVTLFLLPCTIGPYIILGGLLADQGFINALPLLLLYNFVFVLPMIAVIIIVFLGSKKAEDITDWKERNSRKMHLVAGILMLIIGILMITGVF